MTSLPPLCYHKAWPNLNTPGTCSSIIATVILLWLYVTHHTGPFRAERQGLS